ncbi:MAG: hypothetical protein LBT81_05105 [Helicobacteraceae bacterium]|jgi:hypothetical protein|nr:hypothetical protein [Helicobacteraceae bacterium]
MGRTAAGKEIGRAPKTGFSFGIYPTGWGNLIGMYDRNQGVKAGTAAVAVARVGRNEQALKENREVFIR